MDAVGAFAKKHRLFVVEDACQSHGARFKSRRMGSFGDIGCFSFYPSKNLGAFGDGGLMTTNDDALYEKCLRLRNYGQKVKYRHEGVGYNSRLDNLQAALLNVKLPCLDKANAARQKAAALYGKALAGAPVTLMAEPAAGVEHVNHLYVVRSPRRDALQAHLTKEGVGTGIHYPIPLHRVDAFSGDPRHAPSRFPVAEKVCGEILSLPMFPEITPAEVKYVAAAVKRFANP
jgi:dTDP-4-amino-4,6-dideoxygalactose transaminase